MFEKLKNFYYRLRLKHINPENIPENKLFEGYSTYAKVSNVYDGDTLHITFYYKGELNRYRCRLAGIDTPEIKGNSVEERKCAEMSRDYLRNLIDGKIVFVEFKKADKKWNRPVIEIYKNGTFINNLMIKNNYAVVYNGEKKENYLVSFRNHPYFLL